MRNHVLLMDTHRYQVHLKRNYPILRELQHFQTTHSVIFISPRVMVTPSENRGCDVQCLNHAHHPPPTWSPQGAGPAGSAPSGCWHTSSPGSLCPAGEPRSPPAASSSPAAAGTPETTHQQGPVLSCGVLMCKHFMFFFFLKNKKYIKYI